MNKYRNKKTRLDGKIFDSKKEAQRWAELRMLEKAGHLSRLERQPEWPLEVNGELICRYRADFRYRDEHGRDVVEDVKGIDYATGRIVTATAVYKLKKKLMAAIFGIKIKEV